MKLKKAFIRADASVTIGSGHVMRCLTLANGLTDKGMEAFFITRDLFGNMAQYIRDQGYSTVLLPGFPDNPGVIDFQYLAGYWRQDAEETKGPILQNKVDGDEILLIVDHYALDAKWEKALRPYVNQIMVIDDLADRPHACDILLDQNYYKSMNGRYRGLVPAHCQMLLGPKYALLRPEFHAAKRDLRQRDGKIRRILVFFGGSDPTNETVKALEAVKMLKNPNIVVDVVVGASNPHQAEIKRFCSGLSIANFYRQVDNMAELMAQADLAIGAGGVTTWERCFLGLPALIIAVADNQVTTVSDLMETGAVCYLGWHDEVNAEMIAQSLLKLQNAPGRLIEMSRRSLALFEGKQEFRAGIPLSILR